MNDSRRKKLESIKDDVIRVLEDENGAWENMPANLEYSEAWEAMDLNTQDLYHITETIQEIIDR